MVCVITFLASFGLVQTGLTEVFPRHCEQAFCAFKLSVALSECYLLCPT